MFKRPEDLIAEQQEAEEMAAELEAWLAKEEATEQKNRRGAGYRLLNPVRVQIALLMQRGKTVKDIHRALDEALGIKVDLKTVRKFMVENMPEEYASYLGANKRGKKENRVYQDGSKPAHEELTASPTPAEQEEINRHLEIKTSPVQQVKTAEMSAKKPPLTAGDLRAMTGQLDPEKYRTDD
ncbi:hypothetical protein HX799_09180 [Pseudomonas tolaasii]|uniref:hypothetical protein n=1 Tax=Pseudomonas tolaasii TaxID=29442 RepID=UPI0015BE4952|nr:hypothetical protein [Pseudomonas tolaasii]NWC51333.1 hypothetical protein [Pseudomonas tolaasii]